LREVILGVRNKSRSKSKSKSKKRRVKLLLFRDVEMSTLATQLAWSRGSQSPVSPAEILATHLPDIYPVQ